MVQRRTGHKRRNTAYALCMQNTQGFKHAVGISNAYYFPRQHWLGEGASILHYMYIAFLFTISCSHIPQRYLKSGHPAAFHVPYK